MVCTLGSRHVGKYPCGYFMSPRVRTDSLYIRLHGCLVGFQFSGHIIMLSVGTCDGSGDLISWTTFWTQITSLYIPEVSPFASLSATLELLLY